MVQIYRFIGMLFLLTPFILSAEEISGTAPKMEIFNALESSDNINGYLLHCRDYPGSDLCRAMDRFSRLLRDCEGQECYRLWDHQQTIASRALGLFEHVYFDYHLATRHMGQLAKRTAERLCDYQVRGDRDYILRLVRTYNSFIEMLRIIQEMGDVQTPHWCRFSVN